MSTATRFRLIEELFRAAVRLGSDEQAVFLEDNCRHDPALKKAVLALLREDGRTEGTLDRPAFDSSVLRDSLAIDSAHDADAAPDMIGNYRIVRELGRGGMGIVYEAIQDNPRRTVALKVISAGLGLHGMLRRFEQEAAALGRLQHPGIAHIHEAGTFERDGRIQPFFAMEFVCGAPLMEYAARRNLDVRARLALIARICDAVEHAHLHGVIHRDLKPSNILIVDDDSSAAENPHARAGAAVGQPKILDFGVARLTDASVTVTTIQTNVGQLVGTVQYMSPEQATGDPRGIDSRSDVYSLGVLAYEFISGRLPYRLQERLVHEAVRVIREDDPTPLSSINRLYRGDIETIIGKALEKDPARRYQSAAALAADIRRYLSDEPIAARPPSTLYQLRKFARRHKAIVGGVAGGFALMLIGLALSLREAHNARVAQSLAEQKSDEATRQSLRVTLASAAMEIENGNATGAARRLAEIAPADRNFEWRYLNAQLDDSTTCIEDDAPIAGAHLMPDGQSVLTLSRDGVLKRWDAQRGTLLNSRPLCPGPVVDAAFSADGRRIAAVVQNDAFKVLAWDNPESEPVELGTISGNPRLLEMSPRGQWVALAIGATGYHLFDVDARTHRVFETNGTVQSLRFVDDRRLARANGGYVQVIDCASGELLHKVRVENADLAVDVAPDDASFLSGGSGKAVRLFSFPDGRPMAEFIGHTGAVRSVRFVPHSSLILSMGQEQEMRLWDLTSGRMVRRLLNPNPSTYSPVIDAAGATLITRSSDKAVRVWDLRPGPDDERNVFHHDSYVYAVAFSPDGTKLITGGWDKTIRVWDIATSRQLVRISCDEFVSALAVSPDGRFIASGQHRDAGKAAGLALWDAATGALVHKFASETGEAKSVVFAPDGKRFAVMRTHEPPMVYDMATYQRTLLEPHRSSMGSCLDWSRDGRLVAVGNRDRTVHVLAADSGELIREFKIEGAYAGCCAFSPDGRTLALALSNATTQLWDIASGVCTRTLHGHSETLYSVAFSPDGSRLATGSRDTTIRLWDVASGDEMFLLRGHSQYVYRLAFSADGSMLASASGDGTARIWDTHPAHARRRGVVPPPPGP